MKAQSAKHLCSLSILCLTALAFAPRAVAQTPAQLDLHLYAGLSIAGAVGTVYSIQYASNLAQTNDPSAWQCLEFLQLPASPYLWADMSVPATGQRFYRSMASPTPTNMVFIPPGTFRMGSVANGPQAEGNEYPQTAVIISRGFWMGKYEVTQGEYLALIGSTPSSHTGDFNQPVENLYWDDAAYYCSKLTQQERTAGRISANSTYRLPTEAEWEYACRAETSDRRYSYGDDPDYTNLTNYAWYDSNSSNTTHAVGQKLPNPWGLYDMHGNVREMCQDWALGPYPGSIVVDPQGPASGYGHIIRGGRFDLPAGSSRSAVRSSDFDVASDNIGFRVVLAAGQP